jgi:hypothetical protein
MARLPTVRTHGQHDVRALQPVLQRQAAACRQHGLVGHAHELFLEKILHLNAVVYVGYVGERAQGQVQFAVGQLGQHHLARGLADRQLQSWRMAAQVPHQRRQHDARCVIRQGQPQPSACMGRVELRLRQQAVETAQRISQRLHQALRACRERHAATTPHQQRIAQMLAQLGQRMAHGRLAFVQPHGRTRHMSFGQQGVQGQQQVEVDSAQFIHTANIERAQKRFPSTI